MTEMLGEERRWKNETEANLSKRAASGWRYTATPRERARATFLHEGAAWWGDSYARAVMDGAEDLLVSDSFICGLL
jgi:hypothetical protein